MRLFAESACLVLFRYKPNIALFGNVFNDVAIRNVDHQLVEVPFQFVSYALPPLTCVVVYFRVKVVTGRKADGAMHLKELPPAVKVESE